MNKITVWSWRHAIQKSGLGSTTRHVLLNLSIYMNEQGGGCYPTTSTQANDTGLSERSVCTHLEIAEKAGFLIKKKHGLAGKAWSRNEYIAKYPEEFSLGKGTELPSVPSQDVEKYKEKGTEPLSVPDMKALNLLPEGTEPDDIKALKEVQSNSPYNSPYKNIYGQKDFGRMFEEFWEIYPNKVKKKSAKEALKKIIDSSPDIFSEIINGLKAYSSYLSKNDNGFIPAPANPDRWLLDERWNDQTTVKSQNPDEMSDDRKADVYRFNKFRMKQYFTSTQQRWLQDYEMKHGEMNEEEFNKKREQQQGECYG